MNIVHVPVLKACYFLHNAKIYSRIKKTVYAILADPESRWRKPVDGGLSLLVIASVFFLIREVKQPLNGHFPQHFETFTVTVFIVEYLFRFWLHSSVHNTIIKQYEKAAQLNTPFRLRRAIQDSFEGKMEVHHKSIKYYRLARHPANVSPYPSIADLHAFQAIQALSLHAGNQSVCEYIG